MKIVLYSTHCPKCNVLETKLNNLNVDYKVETDIEIMQEKGFMSAPMLEVEGKIMNFRDAVRWVNEMEK